MFRLIATALLLLLSLPVQAQEILTVDEAVAAALVNNHGLRSAEKTTEAAGYRKDQAYSVYYPNLNASTDYQHLVSKSSGGRGVAVQQGGLFVVDESNSNVRDTLGISINARYDLYDPQRPYNTEAAEQTYLAALHDLEGTRLDLALQVRQLYYDTFLDQQLLEIRQQEVANLERHLEQARGFYEAGLRARNEVTRAEADLAQSRLELARARAVLDTDWIELNVAMGLARDTRYTLVLNPQNSVIPEVATERLVEIAFNRRPELAALLARLEAQFARIEAANRGQYPTVSTSAGGNLNGQPTPFDPAWSVGVSINIPLFDGFLDYYTAKEAHATAEAISEEFQQQRDVVYREVASLLATVRQTRVQVETAAIGIQAAEENYRLASERYRVGVGSDIELADAELALTRARSELVVAENALFLAQAQLERALGVYDLADLELENES